MDDTHTVTEANRAAWNEAAPIHEAQNLHQLKTDFANPRHTCLDAIEVNELNRIGVQNKSVAQICCNNGRELISVERMGAAKCVGFEGAEAFVDQAYQIAEAAGSQCSFVCTNIYDIEQQYEQQFDLVTITIGVLCWMPDLERLFQKLARLMKPGAALFIYEQHPIIDMVEPGPADHPVHWDYSYFSTEPWVETDGLDYYSGKSYQSKPLTSFHHKLSDIITAALECGLSVEKFEELPGHISNNWWNLESQGPRVPMSFILTLRR